MDWILLALIVFGVSAQNVAKKAYGGKTGGEGAFAFCSVSVLSAVLFFLVTAEKPEWNGSVLPYSLAFALFYGMAIVFGTLAMGCGALSLTSLFNSYSLILPTLFGLLFLQEPVRQGLFPGLGLLFLSLILIHCKNETVSVTPRWVLYVLLSFVGNGGCSIVQKLQQADFQGAYKSEFMILALGSVFLPLFLIALVRERKKLSFYLKSALWIGTGSGFLNGMVNLLVMVLSQRMAASILFPTVSAGGVVATFAVSLLVYRERLSLRQKIGFALGAASVVLLNL